MIKSVFTAIILLLFSTCKKKEQSIHGISAGQLVQVFIETNNKTTAANVLSEKNDTTTFNIDLTKINPRNLLLNNDSTAWHIGVEFQTKAGASYQIKSTTTFKQATAFDKTQTFNHLWVQLNGKIIFDNTITANQCDNFFELK